MKKLFRKSSNDILKMEEKPKFICDKCGKEFRDRFNMTSHMRRKKTCVKKENDKLENVGKKIVDMNCVDPFESPGYLDKFYKEFPIWIKKYGASLPSWMPKIIFADPENKRNHCIYIDNKDSTVVYIYDSRIRTSMKEVPVNKFLVELREKMYKIAMEHVTKNGDECYVNGFITIDQWMERMRSNIYSDSCTRDDCEMIKSDLVEANGLIKKSLDEFKIVIKAEDKIE